VWCPSTRLVSVALALVKMRGSCALQHKLLDIILTERRKPTSIDFDPITGLDINETVVYVKPPIRKLLDNLKTLSNSNRAFLFGTGFRLYRVMELAIFLSLIVCNGECLW
jgi:hypothetical protein